MSELAAARRALESVPGWRDASVSRLEGGLSNVAYLVQRDDARAILKLDRSPRTGPYNSRVAEATTQAAAAERGLGGRVIHVDDALLLTEYVEGTPWTRQMLGDPARLRELALALRQLHRLPLTGRTFDAKVAARGYFEQLGDADPVIAERCLRTVLESSAPGNLCCCHNDLVVENIIAADDIRFIDWEYAADNDPLFDLATVIAHHELPGTAAELLLDTYFEGDGSRWLPALARQERLYDALNWLWRESRGRI